MTAADPRPTARRGRPRDEGVGEAVRQAARELLAEVGYANTTMAEIAERANVSLPTIYRRWPSKAEVIEHAVLTSSRQRDVDPDSDFETELRLYVRGVVRVMSDPVTRAALPGMLLDLQADREVRERYHQAFAPSMRPFRDLVQRAVADGVVAEDTTADEINLLVTGSAMGTMLDPGRISAAKLEAVIFKLVSRAIGLSLDREG